MNQSTTLTDNSAFVSNELCAGGPIYLQAGGTWGGATLNIDASYDGGTTWGNVSTLTADGFKNIDLPAGAKLRAQLVGGASQSVKVMIR
jgi:hypothetical protein